MSKYAIDKCKTCNKIQYSTKYDINAVLTNYKWRYNGMNVRARARQYEIYILLVVWDTVWCGGHATSTRTMQNRTEQNKPYILKNVRFAHFHSAVTLGAAMALAWKAPKLPLPFNRGFLGVKKFAALASLCASGSWQGLMGPLALLFILTPHFAQT